MYSLKYLAKILDGKIIGNKEIKINRLATLKNANKGSLSFFSNEKYTKDLKSTNASAIIVKKEYINIISTNAIVIDNPYFSFAKILKLFDYSPRDNKLIHKTSIISNSAIIYKNVTIEPNVIIENFVRIKKDISIGANSVIKEYSNIEEKTKIKQNVSIYHKVKIGKKCIIHSNSIIGSDGFGNVKNEKGEWTKIKQIGGVKIEDNVEIGASSTVDRGTIDDTHIKKGVKIDNQVQIAHNVYIGKDTAIAAMSGIAGSSIVGENCLIGGQVGINGHIKICKDVILAATSKVSKSIKKSGFYTAGFNAKPHMEWKRINARIFRLNKLEKRIKKIEKIGK